MRYSYVPGSIVAHDRAMLPPPVPPPAEDACRILVPQQLASLDALPRDGFALAHRVEWCRATYALAERVSTMELIETVTLWIVHGPIWAHVTWTDGRAPSCVVRRPYLHKVSFEALRVMLGDLVIEYGGCERCGTKRVRLKRDGSPGAHRRPGWHPPLLVNCS